MHVHGPHPQVQVLRPRRRSHLQPHRTADVAVVDRRTRLPPINQSILCGVPLQTGPVVVVRLLWLLCSAPTDHGKYSIPPTLFLQQRQWRRLNARSGRRPRSAGAGAGAAYKDSMRRRALFSIKQKNRLIVGQRKVAAALPNSSASPPFVTPPTRPLSSCGSASPRSRGRRTQARAGYSSAGPSPS